MARELEEPTGYSLSLLQKVFANITPSEGAVAPLGLDMSSDPLTGVLGPGLCCLSGEVGKVADPVGWDMITHTHV